MCRKFKSKYFNINYVLSSQLQIFYLFIISEFSSMASKKGTRGRRVNLKSVEIETKTLTDEATGHLKSGIYDKALILYTKVC